MTSTSITESIVEEAALAYFAELGYSVLSGPEIAPDEPGAERTSYVEVVLVERLRTALQQLNRAIPPVALEDALRMVLNVQHDTPSLYASNHRFHQLLSDGVDVEYQASDGRIVHDKVWLFDFAHPDNNDWLAVNQFTVIEPVRASLAAPSNRRPDIVVFVNGLPLGVIELKNAADEHATIRQAFNQLQTYKRDIPSLFTYNEVLVISDGLEARTGTLTADWERFLPWRTIEGDDIAPKGSVEKCSSKVCLTGDACWISSAISRCSRSMASTLSRKQPPITSSMRLIRRWTTRCRLPLPMATGASA
jgi:type I restriction enzyme R subunit